MDKLNQAWDKWEALDKTIEAVKETWDAVYATPEHKAKDEAWIAYIETPAYKAYEEAKKALEATPENKALSEARKALEATPEWKAKEEAYKAHEEATRRLKSDRELPFLGVDLATEPRGDE